MNMMLRDCNWIVYVDFQIASAADLQALAGYNSPDLTANWVAAHGPLTAAIQAAGLQLTNRSVLAPSCVFTWSKF